MHLALAMLLAVAQCVYVCSHGAEHVVLILSERVFSAASQTVSYQQTKD